MKNLFLFCSIAVSLLFSACTDESSTVELTYTKATAVYRNMSDISSSIVSTNPREIVNPGKIFFSESLLLIGEEGKGIHVFDNSNSENPKPVTFIEIPGNHHFFVKDKYLYAADILDMLKIDISDIHNPRLISTAKYSFSENMVNEKGEPLVEFTYEEVTERLDENAHIHSILRNQGDQILYYDYENAIIPASNVPSSFAGGSGQTLGTMNRMVHYKDHLYALTNNSILTFEDVSEFRLQNSKYAPRDMETIYPLGDRLYVGTSSSMLIYDIQNPSKLDYLASFEHAKACDPVLPLENVIYVTLHTGDASGCPGDENALVVLDISNQPLYPQQIQQFGMNSPYGMTMIGETLFVSDGYNGLVTFDATNRHELARLHHFSDIEAFDVLPHPTNSNILLVASEDGLGQYQINGESSLELLSQIQY